MLSHAATPDEHAAHLAPPLDDPVYQTLLACRAPNAVAARLAKAWPADAVPQCTRIVQTHYKPYERARLVVELADERDGSAPRLLYVAVYASDARARKQYEAALAKAASATHTPAVTLLDDWRAVAWSLPNGPKLGSIDTCMDAARFAHLLHDHGLDGGERLPRLLRYVPRKRALFFHRMPNAGALYLKFYRERGAAAAAHNLGLLAAASARGELGFAAPPLAFHAERARAVAMQEVPGRVLSHAIAELSPAVFERVGCALGSLHRSSTRPTLPAWSAEGEVLALRRAMSDVVRALPAVAARLDELLGEIEACRRRLHFEADAPIHGNLFGDQILVAPQGGGIGIVDWDDLCAGDPLYDVGRLVAHLVYLSREDAARAGHIARCVESLLRGHAAASGREPDHARLRWHIAVALLLRAKISALRTLADGWIDDVAFAIDEAEHTLVHDSRQAA